jgi:hypothetical protein
MGAMLKKIIGIIVGVCFCSAQALAADTTWFCSALLEKGDTKPAAFKFEVKGGQLIDLSKLPNDYLRILGGGEAEPTRYKIVEDTDIGLVAVHSTTYVGSDKKATVEAEIILIKKVSGEFLQMGIETKGSYSEYSGTCQVGK